MSGQLARRFRELAHEWESETGNSSIITKRFEHPAYKAIIAIGDEAIPLILNQLRRKPDRWFDALSTLAKCDPAKNTDTFNDAVDAWVSWGIKNALISP